MLWLTRGVRAAWRDSNSLRNLSNKDLISVSMQMHSADNRDIPILGAVILKMSGKDQSGDERTTQQIIYITDSTDELFLSRRACVDFGII